ncbi:MAG: hypothetical protein IKS93_05765 [Methanobrevibacter sp.]|nr:hypothetical protein [Methanobrevibacter sp.]
MEELMEKLRSDFRGLAQIMQVGNSRIELDVSTSVPREEWNEKMKDYTPTDNIISNSWTYNGIRIVLFGGMVKNEKKKFNFTY